MEADRIRELDEGQCRRLFDGATRHYLGVSGEEFLRHWERGHYEDPDGEPGVMSVVMLLPFARREDARG